MSSSDIYAVSSISFEEEIQTLLHNQKEYNTISNARNRKQEKERIEAAIEQNLSNLVSKDQPHLIYYKLCWQNKDLADKFRSAWASSPGQPALEESSINLAQVLFETPKIEIGKLLPYSFVIQFRFKLAQPYISKDETDFYIIDNPVRKDKVFGLPFVAPNSWKGSLRAAARRRSESPDILVRLFGTDKDDQANLKPEDFQAGRLYFFPTFFIKKSLEIINPHDRKRRVGKNPILIESVPAGASGVFTLLYLPFNPQVSKTTLPQQLKEDLTLVAQALHAMLCEYGFGAKTSSGFGLAHDTVQTKTGYIEVNKPDSVVITLPEPQPPTEPENIKKVRVAFPNEDFTLKPKEWRDKLRASSSQMDTYKNAREELRTYEPAQKKFQQDLEEYEAQKNMPPPATTYRPFTSLSNLKEVAKQLTDKDATNE